jgi:excinuclease ABC subunit A
MTESANQPGIPAASAEDSAGSYMGGALRNSIRVRGARQNNLKNLSLDIPTNELVVVTGVSGSGKSSLVFDTVYAEGQRRYVETFSAYARQFLDRMDKPQVDKIEGVPPAIAIDQTNPVRTSRSTVGTMTEVNDHLKLLFSRLANLLCRECAQPVERDSTGSVVDEIKARAKKLKDPRLVVCFPVPVPENFTEEEVESHLLAQGYTKVHSREAQDEKTSILYVIQDRFRASRVDSARISEAIEMSMNRGHGRISVFVDDEKKSSTAKKETQWRFSAELHCARCDISYGEPLPSMFSFNSPLGACDDCRGFGRVIGIDLGLVIPDESKSIAQGAVKPWQTESYKDCQRDLLKHAKKNKIDIDKPWRNLPEKHRHWVIEGDAGYKSGQWRTHWYGIKRFFSFLESKAYKMHIRVLLSKYRAYTPCLTCGGARLKTDALIWRVGDRQAADRARGVKTKNERALFKPVGVGWSDKDMSTVPGLSLHDLMLLPIEHIAAFFDDIAQQVENNADSGTQAGAGAAEALDMLLTELRGRLSYLHEVGLSYLTLDRQSRTLSGGEVQRINLTTALGTSLVNTLFVLDEPSIGLHPRDMNRIIAVMHRLRDAGNSLLVVEHDPQVMFAADKIIDIGPGPGERGGNIVFEGDPTTLRKAKTLTADYLAGRKSIDLGLQQKVANNTPRLTLEGASENNLRGIDIEFPLTRFVTITGVSGSGKSTLIQNVLLPALKKTKGKPTEAPGEFDRLLGDDWIDDVAFVDQSPIGKTARSNPASYVGAFDPIRKRFSATPSAQERGYKPGTFSFNSGDGRCPTCRGNGFEHVEMQFLSDVYLRCPDCDGTRFRPETLEIKVTGTPGAKRTDGSTFGPLSIAQVLDLTISEALEFFATDLEVKHRLRPLLDVGLDYLKLGQPVPTLSGGEAQRLKLAGFLAEAQTLSSPKTAKRRARCGTLFLFDEPTTGLHFDDVSRLIGAFRKLLDAGHSLIVIEHNLDVMQASDWLIDLGPEGGDGGGMLVGQGTPDDLVKNKKSHTGVALKAYRAALKSGRASAAQDLIAADVSTEVTGNSYLREMAQQSIYVHHARENNLKNVQASIPRGALSVITGVSGSGKSTLAFDVIFGEGQRRYLESLNAYARQFVQPASRPDVDGVFGIPPTVAIEQRTSRGGRKSTVATLTEIYHFLRLLFMKLGAQHCPDCEVKIEPQSFDSIVARIMREHRGEHIGLLAPLVVSRKGVYTDLAKWAKKKGFTHLRVDEEFLPTDAFPRIDRYIEHNIELPVADFVVDAKNEAALRLSLTDALEYGKGIVMVASKLELLRDAIDAGDASGETAELPTKIYSTSRACPSCGTSFPELDPRHFSFNSKLGWCEDCFGTGVTLPYVPEVGREKRSDEDTTSGAIGALAEKLVDKLSDKRSDKAAGKTKDDDGEPEWETCESCSGDRLNPAALSVLLRDESIGDATSRPITQMREWLEGWKLDEREAAIGRDLLVEIQSRLHFLEEVGLGYLALNRSAPSLSGGEAQRIRLASQLGSNLQGVCYVLDEPTIGLHPHDNQILLNTLTALRDKGNTLVVVEHDEDTMRRADHIIDIGPAAGRLGGEVIATGSIEDIQKNERSITGKFLANPLQHPLREKLPKAPDKNKDTEWLELKGADLHNLNRVNTKIPQGSLTVVTGVSGSGKSTLARDVLLSNVNNLVASTRRRNKKLPTLVGVKSIKGWERFDRVLEVDQTPIGKTPRSCPATYVGFWDAIRKQFAESSEARLRGYGPGRFSFNTAGGRCPACDGQGQQTIEMSFLPDVKVACDACGGRRFNRETLEILVRGKTIGDVLQMSIAEATEYFKNHTSIAHPLQLLCDVGLGYLTLGQPSPTLSGGEAQRIKLVTELSRIRNWDLSTTEVDQSDQSKRARQHALYVLDEPTVGLHMADVEKLISVLHRLVASGATVVVVEHNLDIWAEADWIIDMGPDGGDAGGRVVAANTPAQLAKAANTHTARALQSFLQS